MIIKTCLITGILCFGVNDAVFGNDISRIVISAIFKGDKQGVQKKLLPGKPNNTGDLRLAWLMDYRKFYKNYGRFLSLE